MADKKLNLLADFPAITTEQWTEVVTKDLKGADFEKKLVWRTNEGFKVQPFYRAENTEGLKTTDVKPAAYPYVRSTKENNEWLIRQDIKVENAKDANKKALDILSRGATSLGFHLKKADLSSDYIAELLKGIIPTAVELNFHICVSKGAELATMLIDYYKANGFYTNPPQLVGSINIDPINKILLKGKDLSKEFVLDRVKSVVQASIGLPFYRVVGVNATTMSNAGAYCAQELGYALAWGNEYLSSLVENGVEKSLAAKKIKFNFGVGSNYFMEIAKFRAARMLWAQIVMAYQPKCVREECPNNKPDGLCRCSAKMRIHAETTQFNMTTFDANVNMLRTQTEAMSATIAGVDSLTVLPYDVTYKSSDEFSERIARNQQLLLKEESHFDKVIDPSAGSYYIETLTKEIAEQAWTIFLQVEDEGGFFEVVKSGTVQDTIKTTALNRLKNISSRREVLLGTNQFPNFSETASQKQEKKDAAHSTTGGCGCAPVGIETLPPVRGAGEFEELRFATENSGKMPKVFMLTIGNLAMRLARAQFSGNFFACAGYKVIDNLGFSTVEDGVAAAMNANAEVVVLCSSDDEYVELVPQAFELLKDKALLVVAGAPACMDDLKAKGIQHFIHVKSNVLETLKEFNSLLRV
ncbi:MAG: methylmalonyl-CoA mutase small subunit [Paludibacteraceae bacterium]